jgi:hypothetical protein
VIDIDYNALLASYQKKVTELINQNIVYEAKLNSQSNLILDLQAKITELESSKSKKKIESSSEEF